MAKDKRITATESKGLKVSSADPRMSGSEQAIIRLQGYETISRL